MWTLTLTYPERPQRLLEAWEDQLAPWDAMVSAVPGQCSNVTLHLTSGSLATAVATAMQEAETVTGMTASKVQLDEDSVRARRLGLA